MNNKIIIINGPNLNLLGEREQSQYGSITFDDLKSNCLKKANEIEINLESFELNLKVSEKEIKDRLSKLEKHEPLYKTGVLGKYTKLVQPASKGAVTG